MDRERFLKYQIVIVRNGRIAAQIARIAACCAPAVLDFATHTERREKSIRIRNQIVKGIHDAGGKIMTDSDTPELFLLYGFSLHRELKILVDAGLRPYAALEAATRVPAEFLKVLGEAGTIERGKWADLILLEANPLDDISNTEKRAGVMTRGRWMPEAELKKMLDEIAPRFQSVPNSED